MKDPSRDEGDFRARYFRDARLQEVSPRVEALDEDTSDISGTLAQSYFRFCLTKALEHYFEPPQATRPPKVRLIKVEVGAA